MKFYNIIRWNDAWTTALKMGQNFDLQVSIHPNLGNIFMAVVIDLWPPYSPLNSAKLSC